MRFAPPYCRRPVTTTTTTANGTPDNAEYNPSKREIIRTFSMCLASVPHRTISREQRSSGTLNVGTCFGSMQTWWQHYRGTPPARSCRAEWPSLCCVDDDDDDDVAGEFPTKWRIILRTEYIELSDQRMHVIRVHLHDKDCSDKTTMHLRTNIRYDIM